ncbi:MAG: diguanylate cyclase [Sphingomonadaceae bacterium]|nr:diguanylate cyclase [Sphingomonadaceae bacterium]
MNLVTISDIAVATAAAMPMTRWSDFATGVMVGLVVLPAIYNIGYYAVLRQRFLLLHGMRSATIALMVVMLSPMALGSTLAPGSVARYVIFFISLDCAIAVSGPFLRDYVERGKIDPRLARLLGLTPVLVLVFTPAMFLIERHLWLNLLRETVLLAVFAILVAALVQATLRGSRTIRFQIAAWAGILAVCAVSLAHNLILHRPWPDFFSWLFAALTLEVMLTTIGVTYRFMQLRHERDDARRSEDAMTRAAMTDPLTGLPNRRALFKRFSSGGHKVTAVALVDLDRFKAVNDDFGHDIGDDVLIATAEALRDKRFGANCYAARLGGEEFALLLFGDQPAVLAVQIRLAIADHIEARVAGVDRRITASLGLAHAQPGDEFAALLKQADLYLYKAKSLGRDCQQNDLGGSYASCKAAA